MKQPRSNTPQRKPRKRWRWHIPPAILHGPETLEGTQILDELTGEAGLVLWQSLRDVTLWSSLDPERREGLFAAGAGERRRAALLRIDAGEVAPALDTLAALVEDPAGAESEAVTQSCREISEWTDAQGHLATALAFAQAAALASPRNAAAGFRVGLLARKKAEYARAETWFRRTVGLARQAKDWVSYSKAFLGLANLYIQRGNDQTARQMLIRAYRAAKRHSLRPILGAALHDMFGIAIRAGQHQDAEEYAREAFNAYGPDHPRIPALAHDVAYFWMEQGYCARALPVLQALLPQLHTPGDRIGGLGGVAHTAGAAGRRDDFEAASAQIWRLAGESEGRENVAEALLDLAFGAMSLSDWAAAEAAASTAHEVATERQEARVLLKAEEALDAIRRREVEARQPASEVASAEEADAFAAELVRSLEEHAAAG